MSGNQFKEGAQVLYGMAQIKGIYRDFANSEVLNIKAIELFKKHKNEKYLHKAYNHLALLQVDIREYDKALNYYNKSLEYYNQYEDKNIKYLGTYNNMANVFLEREEYNKALKFYNLELKKEISD